MIAVPFRPCTKCKVNCFSKGLRKHWIGSIPLGLSAFLHASYRGRIFCPFPLQTKKGFRLSNLRCLIFTSRYCPWNSKSASVCVFSSTCLACSMCCCFAVLFLITSFLSPVGLLTSYDQKLKMSCLCSVLIASPLVFLSRSSQLFFS